MTPAQRKAKGRHRAERSTRSSRRAAASVGAAAKGSALVATALLTAGLQALPASASAVSAEAQAATGTLAPAVLEAASPQTAVQALAPAALAPRSANIRVTLVTLQTKDKTAADLAKIDVAAAKAAVTGSDQYWRSVSAGKMTIGIEKTVLGFKTSVSSGAEFSTIMNTVQKELGWTGGTDRVLVLFIPRTDVVVYGSGGNLGAGWASGPTSGRILLPITSNFTGPVMAHEFGHVFGLGHANSLQCTNGRMDVSRLSTGLKDTACTSRAYGGTTDLMGISQWAKPYLNAALLDYSGFGRGDELRTVTPGASATYNLTAWAGTAARRALKFTDAGGETYYVQLRLPVGFDSSTAVNGNRGVEILKADDSASESLLIPPSTKPYSGWYITNAAWQAGQTFTTWSGTKVKVNSISSTGASVTVTGPGLSYQGTVTEDFSVLDEKAAASNLGDPLAAGISGLRDGGKARAYQRGSVHWTEATDAHVTRGAIRGAWARAGAQNGALRYPTTDEVGGLRDSGVRQLFQGGSIYWTPTTGAQILRGAVRNLWLNYGAQDGYVRYPTTGEVASVRGGVVQNFQRGTIFWHPTYGAHRTIGAIRGLHVRYGAERGFIGYPTAEEVHTNGGAYQNYERGTITWSGSGTYFIFGGIRNAWLSRGAQGGVLGWPTSGQYSTPDGSVAQNFQGGRIYWKNGVVRVVTF
ncbi:hypothetical protein [Sinomonas halotolerans]|uniref:LGFP repeat-containing protein n=1 Tax=Sinomonas halotolerans TaxID=1644133 RepID=A0ABU9X0Q4_9MICC